MEQPKIKHIYDDTKSGVLFEVLAYRQLTREEVIGHIKVALAGMKKSKRPKRGERLTIHTLAD